MVHGKGFRGTERGEGHGWYTGGAPEVRNGMEGTVGTREGLLRYGTGWRTRLVHGRGFCGTERGEGHGWYTGGASAIRNGMEGHGWYTGGASAVRNGMEGTVGTRVGLLRYGTGWRARLVHGKGFRGTERDGGHGWYTGGEPAVRNGMEGTVGTPQWVLVYEMYGKKDLYTR